MGSRVVLKSVAPQIVVEDVVATVLQGLDYKQIDDGHTTPVAYTCPCSRDRALGSLAMLGREEVQEIIEEGGTTVACQFCGRKYQFSGEDLLALTATHDA